MYSAKRFVSFFLLLFVFGIFIETYENVAEARGRGRAFGRQARSGGGRRRVRQARVRRNNGGQRRVVRNNDIFGLDIQPVNAFSNLALDPTGDLQRLALFNNIAINRNGQLFELNNGNILDPRQQLLLNGNQVFGGVNFGLQNDTINQLQLLNALGDFRTLR
jgi:hypothetical protein